MIHSPLLARPAPASPTAKLVAAIAAIGLIGLPLFALARHHLASPNLWFDEAGQFWLARGLHHFSAPNSAAGGWDNFVDFGRVFNSDPGLFTLLLHGWMAVFGTTPLALRGLPFFLFLLTPGTIYWAARRIGAAPLLAVFAASLPLGFPMLLHYATEIRAYSMETSAVALLFFVPCWLQGETRKWPVVLLGCVAALLVASRYSAFLFAAAACLTALFPLRPFRPAFTRATLFAIPVILAVAIGYLLFARYQAGGTHRAPAYTESYLLQGKDAATMLAQLRANFFGREAWPIVIFLLFAPIFSWLGPKSLAAHRSLIARTALFTALSVVFALLGSYFGKLPWALQTRWSIGYQALSVCCLAMTLLMIGIGLGRLNPLWLRRALLSLLAIGGVGMWSTQLARAASAERPYYETIASHLQALAREPGAKDLRFYIQTGSAPAVRYLCEYGPLQGKFSYPERFHFETGEELTAAAPISAKENDIVVLTHFSLLESHRKRVIDGTVEVHADPQPSCLLFLKPEVKP